MLFKLWKRDVFRNKLITLTLYCFLLLSSFLAASSGAIIMKLSTSMEQFFQDTAAPDFVQMHTEAVDQADIATFVKQNEDIITKHQSVTLANLKGSELFINQKTRSEDDSVMEVALVKQNQAFDYLIGEDNTILHLSSGQIAVPVYYQERDGLSIKDTIYVKCNNIWKEFEIVSFLKDAQMNPSIISSKRMLVSDEDYAEILPYASKEYLLEFQSKDASALELRYQKSTLPQNGTAITKGLLMLLNALMDGITALVLLLISFLLMGIAFLCLRFTILMTLQEDVKEIGVMKAIGLAKKDIQRFYMGKYILLVLLGGASGYLCMLLFQPMLFQNIQLYMGIQTMSASEYLLALLMCILLGLFILGFCRCILSSMHKITPLQALRTDAIQDSMGSRAHFSFTGHLRMPVALYLSIQDLLHRKRMYYSLFFVLVLSSFLMILPQNLQATISSKDFIRYMGIGNSDLRMDIFYDENTMSTKQELTQALQGDEDVTMYADYSTYQSMLKNADGEWQKLQVETGDFTKFPLSYHRGEAPSLDHEIAISYAVANEQALHIGDEIELMVQEEPQIFRISGIYQDVTNGGKSAKLLQLSRDEQPLHSTINVNFKEGISLSDKLNVYRNRFTGLTITDTQGYITQTLSSLLAQIQGMARIALGIAIFITFLQISLFLKMVLKKDEGELTILHCIGFSKRQLQMQYMVTLGILTLLGIIAGTLMANIGGEYICSLAMQSMGIARLSFTIQPWITYGILPLILLSCVIIACILTTNNIQTLQIANVEME